MMIALKLLKRNPSAEFMESFARATGMMEQEAELDPDKLYTIREAAELFTYLFELEQETPAAGTARESR